MKSVKAPPGAKRLIESLRNLGYECSTAIADLIDNSLAADASEISVEIFPRAGSIPAHIVIADNGRGMDADKLVQAMRYGAFQEYSEEDLGKYGLGLKTASLSQCTELTVASRPAKSRGGRAARNVAIWDLAHVYKTDDWDLLTPSFGELSGWKKKAIEQAVNRERGTVVLWSGLEEVHPLLCSTSSGSRDRYLAQLIDEVGSHLSMVFHRFMQGVSQDRPKVRMSVCGTPLKPWDPFCSQEDTKALDIFKQSVTVPGSDSKKATVTMKPYILPREDEFSSREAWKEASGPRSWNSQQGFYFYRNNRLLQAGSWSYLRTPDEHTKLLRVAVNFPASLDKAFALNITKMRAHIPAEIRDATRDVLSRWVKPARTRYDRGVNKQSASAKPHSKDDKKNPPTEDRPQPSVRLAGINFTPGDSSAGGVMVTRDGPDITVTVPRAHDGSLIFDGLSGRRGELTKLCLAMVCLLEALNDHRVRPADIPLRAIRRLVRRHL